MNKIIKNNTNKIKTKETQGLLVFDKIFFGTFTKIIISLDLQSRQLKNH